VFSVRLSEEDIEFLREQRNASEFFHVAIEEEKKKQRMSGGAFSYEIVNEIAEAYVKDKVSTMTEREDDQEGWKYGMQNTLYNIASLTLKLQCPISPNKAQLEIPSVEEMDDLLERLQSKEARNFIQTMRTKVEQAWEKVFCGRRINPEKIAPLTDAELDLVKKIHDEAKYQLEKQYRKTFHKLHPEDWHLYITDTWMNRNPDYGKRFRYNLP
jgi:hypothetical protein